MKNLYNLPTHLFAFHYANLSHEIAQRAPGQEILIKDPDLTHRLTSVLRINPGEQMIFFDRSIHATLTMIAFVKHKSITVILLEKQKNVVWEPAITFLLPLLKKDSLETALYSLSELGITRIQLIITQKSQQKWTAKEHERAQKIIIAAAEQSKNFAFPELAQPLPLKQTLEQITDAQKIFFDPAGQPLAQHISDTKRVASFVLAIGPEGDVIAEEKELFKSAGFNFTALTPTVLRSSQAAALGAGIIRSLKR